MKDNNRVQWIDFGKGFTILLVVIGHLTLGLYQSGKFNSFELECLLKVTSFIYNFHMPVFFALSGYFLKVNLNRKESLNYVILKFINLWIPYILFTFLMFVVKLIGSSQVRENVSIQSLNFVLYPIQHLWFLQVLPFIFLIATLMYKLLKKDNVVLMTSFLICMIIQIIFSITGWISYPILRLVFRIFVWLPIFLIGRYWREIKYKSNKKLLVMFSILFLISQTISTICAVVPTHYLEPKGYYLSFIISAIFAFVIFQYICGISKNKFINYFSKYGKYSMIIYLCHAPILSVVRIILFKLGMNNLLLQICIGLLIAWYGSIFMIYLSKKFIWIYRLFYPNIKYSGKE